MASLSDKKFGQLTVQQCFAALESGIDGLSDSQANQRLSQFGKNELDHKKKNVAWSILVGQFSNFLVILLFVAAVFLYFVVGETLDALVIMGIVVLNGVVGFFQEFKAENAVEALRKMSSLKTAVLRNNRVEGIDAELVVPGDVVLLEAGDRIPADGRLIESFSVLVDESILTGESEPVEKDAAKIVSSAEIADQANQAFKQTTIVNGKARLLVTATGMQTEIGKIAGMLGQIESEETPMVKRLKKASVQIGFGVIALSVVIVLAGIWKQKDLVETVLLAISLAVAAVPEGLPMIITITLAIGATAMASKKSIVRRLQAVETVGNCTVVCSDKTGTLTKNEMNLTTIAIAGSDIRVLGSGFSQEGSFSVNGKEIDPNRNPILSQLIQAMVLANDAVLEPDSQSGDPTEIALLVTGKKAGIDRKTLLAEFELVDENPFSTERKCMSAQFRKKSEFFVFAKGSAEVILEKATKIQQAGGIQKLGLSERRQWEEKTNQLSNAGQRVLAIAYKKSVLRISKEAMESDLVLLGLVGMIDSPRPEAKEALAKCRQAGIAVKMITGDHPLTAFAIGSELGMAKDKTEVLTGAELDQLSGRELEQAILQKTIFARVNPGHKMTIVNVLQKHGHVVAMTGDGVNDAPALKQADVGLAMGLSGTDVAKEASDIVLADDNFATIVAGIEEGRRIYSNIRGFIRYLFSANLAEILIVLIAMMLDWKLVLIPIHLLWLNLVTDGFPALALGSEKGESDAMKQRPRPLRESLLHNMKAFIGVSGILGAIVTMGVFGFSQNAGNSLALSRTLAFNTLVFFELVLVFNCRSESKTVLEKPFWDNRNLLAAVLGSTVLQVLVTQTGWLEAIFETVPLTLFQWGLVAVLALTAVLVPYGVRIGKLFTQRV